MVEANQIILRKNQIHIQHQVLVIQVEINNLDKRIIIINQNRHRIQIQIEAAHIIREINHILHRLHQTVHREVITLVVVHQVQLHHRIRQVQIQVKEILREVHKIMVRNKKIQVHHLIVNQVAAHLIHHQIQTGLLIQIIDQVVHRHHVLNIVDN